MTEVIKLSGEMKEIDLTKDEELTDEEFLEIEKGNFEIVIRYDNYLKEASFSCGYATTSSYSDIRNKTDLAEALEDYVKDYNLMKEGE